MTYAQTKRLLAAIYADEDATRRATMSNWDHSYAHALTLSLPDLLYAARYAAGYRRQRAINPDADIFHRTGSGS